MLELPSQQQTIKEFITICLKLLIYLNTSHGISLANYDNHYTMAFDFTSTQEASHDFIHPESVIRTISVELKFDEGLSNNVELIFMAECASTVYVRSDRKIIKNTLITKASHG